jgi:hypothetical protein
MRFYSEAVIQDGQRHPTGYEIKSSGGKYIGALGVIYDAVLAQRIVELLNADVRQREQSR